MTAPKHNENDVTSLLNAWKSGNTQASQALFEIIYPALRKIVGPILAREGRNLTLDTTDVVHEVYLKMVDQKKADWNCRAQFYAVSAQAVRRIIVDHARHRNRKKRGRDFEKVSLQTVDGQLIESNDDWLALDRALSELFNRDPQAARVVELRYFGGMNNDEIAVALEIGVATVGRRWRFARAWLKQFLSGGSPQSAS